MLSIRFSGNYRRIYKIIKEGKNLIQLVYKYIRRHSREAQESWSIEKSFTHMQHRLIGGRSQNHWGNLLLFGYM